MIGIKISLIDSIYIYMDIFVSRNAIKIAQIWSNSMIFPLESTLPLREVIEIRSSRENPILFDSSNTVIRREIEGLSSFSISSSLDEGSA